ncbi:hypothetical protein BGX33_008037 [Mortierella sp. NVP41]|nr:hypothetical protein BGX33_008037 [Mortierella sp. NVP41]
MSTTTTTTTITSSSCDSPSTTLAANAAAGVAATCVIPPVGRDNVRYGSLDAAAMNNEGALLPSMTLIDTESWLHTTPSPGIDTPMTGTAASSRRISADTGLEQTGVSSTFNHSMFKPSTMVTDQDTAAAAALSNGLRISSDQESVHPLQVDPEPRPSFGDSGATAAPSSSSSTTLTLSFSSTSSPSSSSLTSPFTGESWLSSPPTSSKIPQSTPTPLTIQTQEAGGLPAHKSIREKSSLASKIRRVFNKPMGGNNNNSNNNNPSTKGQDVGINNQRSAQALEDIVSMTSREGDHGDTQGGGGFLGANELYSPGSAHLIEHRGSVSSSSSGESMSVGQDGFSPSTPSTSPEMSPSGSPKPKHALASLVTTGSTVAGVVPDGHPLSPVEIDNLAVLSPTTPTMGKPSEKRMSMELTSSRTTKKRLSFATITSFFHPSRNNSDSTTAFNNKKKQQRSSSVPNVEPVGLQVSGTPRRHSLNDLENSPQMQAKFSAPPWDKDRVSAKAAAVAAEVLVNSSNKSNKAHNENESSTPGTTTATMTTMSKIQGVFGKQSKKNKNKKNASLLSESTAPTATPESPTSKPLRSALVHRPLRTPSVRKAPAGRHVHQNEPLVIFSQGAAGVNNNSGSSRRSSEEQGRAGPTRHRRTSSIAGRQASQQGHYSAVDRKQCHSVLYSSSEEYDIVQHSDLYTNNQHQQQQQYQYHGGYIQYKGSVVPPAPTSRVNPVSTNDLPCNLLATTSPSTSRGAAAEGSFTFSPTGSRRRDSYPSCSSGSPSEDTSPKLASAAHNPNRRGSYDANSSTIAAAAAIGNPNRRSSYDANAGSMAAVIGNPNRRSSYDANSSVIAVAVSSPYRHSSYDANSPVGYNSRRSSIVVTSPSPLPAPVARLSVDHTLMSDHLSPSSPSARYPQAVSPNNAHHHALFANHQQQQQLQLQQQLHFQQQQQQFHQRSQQQRYQHHHHVQYDHHHQQQFMNPHAGPQVFQNQYHIQQQQPQKQQYQQYPSYPPYAYQYNMQQPLPSHLYYPSVQQHPGLISSSYAPVTTMPQYVPPKGIIVHNHASNGGPYPASCWSPSPSPHSPRPPRQLQFSTAQPLIHETWTPDQYDRTSDPNITAHRLTPAIAQRIKLELNTFKSQEMMVHQDSRINTHFFA